MLFLRLIPTVRLAKASRLLRGELEQRAEYAMKFGVHAPGQLSLAGIKRAFGCSTYYPTPPILPIVVVAIAVMIWWALR